MKYPKIPTIFFMAIMVVCVAAVMCQERDYDDIADAPGSSVADKGAAVYAMSAQPVLMAVTPKELTVSGFTVDDKSYDGTTGGTIHGTPVLNGLDEGDSVTLSEGTVVFENRNAGNNKQVSVSFEIGGPDAAKYVLIQPGPMTASISPRIIVLDTVIDDKVYDGTTSAQMKLPDVPPGSIIEGDAVMIMNYYKPQFYTKEVGNNKHVYFPGFTLQGTDKDNYVLSQPDNLTASITAKHLTVTGIYVFDKTYDGIAAAGYDGTPSLSGVADGDVVAIGDLILKFSDKDAGADKPVTVDECTLTGADAANYVVDSDLSLTASITPAELDATYVGETVSCINISPAYQVTVTGFVNGESESLPGFVRPVVDTMPPAIGSILLTPYGGNPTGNYTFSYNSGEFIRAHPHMDDGTVGSLGVHICDTCHRTYVDSAGLFEYVPTGEDSAAVCHNGWSQVHGLIEAHMLVDYAKDAKTAVPVTNMEAVFSTLWSDSIYVPADAVKQSGEAGIPVILRTKEVSAEVPAGIVKGIAGTGHLNVSGSVVTDVKESMKKYIDSDTVVVDVSFTLDGQPWTQFGDKVRISLPYELRAGQTADSLRIICLSGDEPEYFDATYDPASKTVSFETTHCSQFAVAPPEPAPASGGIGLSLIAGVIIAVAAAAGIAAWFLFVRKRAA